MGNCLRILCGGPGPCLRCHDCAPWKRGRGAEGPALKNTLSPSKNPSEDPFALSETRKKAFLGCIRCVFALFSCPHDLSLSLSVSLCLSSKRLEKHRSRGIWRETVGQNLGVEKCHCPVQLFKENGPFDGQAQTPPVLHVGGLSTRWRKHRKLLKCNSRFGKLPIPLLRAEPVQREFGGKNYN